MLVLVLDDDLMEARRNWAALSDIVGDRWREGRSHIPTLRDGAIVLAHNYSDGTLMRLLASKKNLVVINVSAASRTAVPGLGGNPQNFGWLYRRAAPVTRDGLAEFIGCLHTFIRVRERLRSEQEPPFLLLEPTRAGPAWDAFVAGRGNAAEAKADFQRRIPLYRRAGLPLDPMIDVQVAEAADDAALRTLLQRAADALREWVNAPPPPERPEWFDTAWKVCHDALKNEICKYANMPDILYNILAGQGHSDISDGQDSSGAACWNRNDVLAALESVRCGWQEWSEQHPIPLQNLRQFEALCSTLRTAIDKFIDAFQTVPPAVDEAEALRKAASELSKLLYIFQRPNGTSVLDSPGSEIDAPGE